MRKLFYAILLLISPKILAVEHQGAVFDNVIKYFEGALVPSLSHSEAAKVITTLRGFHLRADSHPGMHDEYEPSELGIYLNVAVRDAEEILAFKDSTTTKGLFTTRTVEFPVPKNELMALRVIFSFGNEAPEQTLEAIRASIKKIIIASGHATDGKQQ